MAMDLPEGVTNHPVNKRGVDKLLVSVWDFGPVYPQTEREYYLCNDHPAKMRPALANAILQVYGESPVLDPMAGVGTTLVEAMLLGINAVGVEFEEKFVAQANKNIEHVRKRFPDRSLGQADCVKGDARDLTCLNGRRVNSIVFSPPYHNAIKPAGIGHKNSDGDRQRVITEQTERMRKLFEEGKFKRDGSFLHVANPSSMANQLAGYGSDSNNIGNLKEYGVFNSIIFSPPYWNALHEPAKNPNCFSAQFSREKNLPGAYSDMEENLGNRQHYRTYLQEMIKVYSECFRILNQDKYMIVVVKDIRRNWLTIPLCADTIKLCQMAGFKVFNIIINKMYFPSFWQLSRAKKDQEKGVNHPLRTHEYVLVFRK
jgi:DNA modification methylase